MSPEVGCLGSAKTVGHHVQRVYEEAGVRSRAAASL
jgi:hypothetical protein